MQFHNEFLPNIPVHSFLLIIVFSCSTLSFIHSQSENFVISAVQDEYNLNNNIDVLADPQDTLDVNNILLYPVLNQFQTYQDPYKLDPKTTYWLKVTLDNQLTNRKIMENWKLFIGEVDLMEVYKISRDMEILDIQKGGLMQPAKDKSLNFGNKFSRVDLSFEDHYPYILLIKVERTGNEEFIIDLRLKKYDFYQSWIYVLQSRLDWLFLGFVATMLVFNLIFFFGTWDKAFLYHALFITGALVFTFEFFALTQDLPLVRNNQKLKQVIDYGSLGLMDFAYYQFIRHYLNLKTLLPKWDTLFLKLKYVKIIVYTLIIIHAYFIYNIPLSDNIFAVFIMSQFLLVVFFLFPVYKTKDKKGIILIVGSLFLFFGIFFNGISVIYGQGLFIAFTMIGITGEITSFSLGLGYRMKELRDNIIKEERKTNARLREIDQLKNQFLANTTHELKTPLQGIIGISENLLENEHDQKNKEDLELVINSSKRLNNLINDLLDFSKLKNHDIVLNIKEVNLFVMVDIIVKMLQPLVRHKNIELLNAVPQDLPNIQADENRLQQILYNVIHNGIKFTEKGYVKVDANVEGSQMVISVTDTGIGVAKDKIETIFKEFQQADGSISRKYSGSGLGLSISKQLVELHDGRIEIDSKPNVGSEFRISLPILSLSVEKAEVGNSITDISRESKFPVLSGSKQFDSNEIPFPNIKPNGGSFNILIVDDEPINQQVLRNHLQDSIYFVHSVMSGAKAIEFINQNDNIDLILLDLMLPQMSGYEVCMKIREKYLPSELPIIMVTAKNQIQDLIHGFKVGANDYLSKPFSKDEFIARVKTQLNLYNYSMAAGKFVPMAFIHALGRETITEVKIGDQVQKNVTVLFSDIRGYTTIAESMSLTENFTFVGDHVSEMGPIIVKNKGFVNQFLGDSIMAIFPDSPTSALQAAIEMQRKLNERNDAIGKDEKELRIGIGFHTGNLMMGIIGDQSHSQPVTIADTVNIAARIESLTKYFGVKILLSDTSLNEISETERFDFRFIGNIQMKGKVKEMGIYECINGDKEEVYWKKKDSMTFFRNGLAFYLKKDFPRAAVAFQDILNKNPDDNVAAHYLQRSAHYIANGVPDGWTGTEVMDFK